MSRCQYLSFLSRLPVTCRVSPHLVCKRHLSVVGLVPAPYHHHYRLSNVFLHPFSTSFNTKHVSVHTAGSKSVHMLLKCNPAHLKNIFSNHVRLFSSDNEGSSSNKEDDSSNRDGRYNEVATIAKLLTWFQSLPRYANFRSRL